HFARLPARRVAERRTEAENSGRRTPVAFFFHRPVSNRVAVQTFAPGHPVPSYYNRYLFTAGLPLIIDLVAFGPLHLAGDRVPSVCGEEDELAGFAQRFR